MRKCPFCKQEVKLEMPAYMYLPEIKQWSLLHHCNNNKSILIVAETEAQVVAEWNGCESSD
jgi:hypothetical protein